MSKFLMSTPSNEFLQHFDLPHKRSLIEWCNLQNAITECGGMPISVGFETDTGRAPIYFDSSISEDYSENNAWQIISEATSEQIVFDSNSKTLWFGYSCDAEFKLKRQLDEAFDNTSIMVRALPLEDSSRFPTLSHCMNILTNGNLVWYPDVFSAYSRELLESFYPNNIKINDSDAANFACSFLELEKHLITPIISDDLRAELKKFKHLKEIDMSTWHSKRLTMKSLTNRVL